MPRRKLRIATPAPKPAEPPAPPPANEAPKANATPRPEDIGPTLETNPAVLSALELPRKSPRDYFQAVLWLIDLGRPELAKPIFGDLTKLPLTDAQRAALVDQFGSSSMLKVARAKELAPGGAAFADACMATVAAAMNNPQRIAALVKQLTDPSPEVRAIAQHDLAATGQRAATATLEAIASETNPSRRAVLATGVAAMHPLVDGMLLAMLDTRDASLRAQIVALLRELKVPQAIPLFNRQMRSPNASLPRHCSRTHTARRFLCRTKRTRWSFGTGTMRPSNCRRSACRPSKRELSGCRSWHVLCLNSDRRTPIISDKPWCSRGKPRRWTKRQMLRRLMLVSPRRPNRLLNDVLTEAIKDNRPHAAVAAANALAQRGDRSVLLTADGKLSPLADALASPNRNVRFAALGAIMTLDPSSPYPGSSRVPDALAWFAASSTAERRVIVAMPTIADASDLAGQLAAEGLVAEATNRGRDAVHMARDMYRRRSNFRRYGYYRAWHSRSAIRAANESHNRRSSNRHSGRRGTTRSGQATGRRTPARDCGASPPFGRSGREHRERALGPRQVRRDSAKRAAAQATQARAWLAKIESGDRPFYVIRRTALLNFEPPSRNSPANLPPQ